MQEEMKSAAGRHFPHGKRMYKAIVLGNPSYFGGTEKRAFIPALEARPSTEYEEIARVGHDSARGELVATVIMKRASQRDVDVRPPVFVRFYLSFDGGVSFRDQGVAEPVVTDPGSGGPFEVSFTLPASLPVRGPRRAPAVRVRAILSWGLVPLPDRPGEMPVWGDVMEADI